MISRMYQSDFDQAQSAIKLGSEPENRLEILAKLETITANNGNAILLPTLLFQVWNNETGNLLCENQIYFDEIDLFPKSRFNSDVRKFSQEVADTVSSMDTLKRFCQDLYFSLMYAKSEIQTKKNDIEQLGIACRNLHIEIDKLTTQTRI